MRYLVCSLQGTLKNITYVAEFTSMAKAQEYCVSYGDKGPYIIVRGIEIEVWNASR